MRVHGAAKSAARPGVIPLIGASLQVTAIKGEHQGAAMPRATFSQKNWLPKRFFLREMFWTSRTLLINHLGPTPGGLSESERTSERRSIPWLNRPDSPSEELNMTKLIEQVLGLTDKLMGSLLDWPFLLFVVAVWIMSRYRDQIGSMLDRRGAVGAGVVIKAVRREMEPVHHPSCRIGAGGL